MIIFSLGGGGDFGVLRQQIAKKNHSSKAIHGRNQGNMSSESCLSQFSKKFEIGSHSYTNKISTSPSERICRNGIVFIENVSPPTSFAGITSNFVFGVFSDTETELAARFLISSPL